MSQTIVHKILDAAFEFETGIDQLRALYKGQERPAIRAALLPDVASWKRYKVSLVAGEGKAEGTMVLDSEHPKYEACRKALGRLVVAVAGEVSAKVEAKPIKVSKTQRSAAMSFLSQFEGETLAQQVAEARKVLAALLAE
jgi:hypothetical protein